MFGWLVWVWFLFLFLFLFFSCKTVKTVANMILRKSLEASKTFTGKEEVAAGAPTCRGGNTGGYTDVGV